LHSNINAYKLAEKKKKAYKMKNVFITGATGFIGSRLASVLNDRGYSIYQSQGTQELR